MRNNHRKVVVFLGNYCEYPCETMTTHQEDNSHSHDVVNITREIEGIIIEKYRYSQRITDTIEPPEGKHRERKCGLPCLTWLPKMPGDTNYHFVERGGSLSAFTLLQRTMVKISNV